MKKKSQPIKLDLGDVKFDLLKPWPLKDNSVEEATCVHKLEYIPAKSRVHFMDELWRCLIPGGKASFTTAYWTSPRSIQDPAYEWPPIAEQSFLYFNREYRSINKLPAIKADFDFTYGYAADPETAARNIESQTFWVKHYNNSVLDLQTTLTARK